MADLYDWPDLYDALLPAGAHVPFYVDVARRQGGAILELACGTGQLTIPMATPGVSTFGLDRSLAMLNAAKRHAAAAGAPVAFLQGDMRGFALAREFALIVVARNSLLHLLSTDDLLSALTAIRSHLAPDGVCAFDIFNPDVRILAGQHGERLKIFEVGGTRFGTLTVDGESDYEASAQVSRGTWHISASDRHDRWTVPMVLRSIFPQELPLLLSAAGLTLTARFGDLSRTPFGARSRMQVCLCRRA